MSQRGAGSTLGDFFIETFKGTTKVEGSTKHPFYSSFFSGDYKHRAKSAFLQEILYRFWMLFMQGRST